MAIRLLQKHEVDDLKARERLQEMREGAKLAKSVDDLRKMESDEKLRITKWRDVSLEQVKKELETTFIERDRVRAELDALKLKQEYAQVPLDAVWKRIASEKAVNEEEMRELQRRERVLEAQERQNLVVSRQTELEKSRAEDERARAQEMLAQADVTRKSIKEELASARNLAQSITSTAELREKQALEREQQVAVRERDSEIMFAWVTAKEAEFITKEQNLRARYQDLEATAERIKRGKL